MARYRKKPVVIEAHRWDPQEKPKLAPDWLWDTLSRYPEWCNEQTGVLTIHTLEGDMQALPGDWIIRGVKGELCPCKPDIFAATYEPVAPEKEERT